MDFLCYQESILKLSNILGLSDNEILNFPESYVSAIENLPYNCGPSASWSTKKDQNGNYILSIKGNGETYSWNNYEKTPWARKGIAPISILQLDEDNSNEIFELGANLIKDNTTIINLNPFYTNLYSKNFSEAYKNSGPIVFNCDSLEHWLALNRVIGDITNSDKELWIDLRIKKENEEAWEKITSITVPENISNLSPLELSNLKGVTEIIIPNSVESGLEDALYFTEDLSTITISENNQFYSAENLMVFNKDKSKLLKVYNASDAIYLIPSTVTSIDENAFNVLTATGIWEFNLQLESTTMVAAPKGITFEEFFGVAAGDDYHRIAVPDGLVSQYLADDFWKNFGKDNIDIL